MVVPPLKFTAADAFAAGEKWGFNCGPAALCATLGMTPDELRPHLLDFEEKRYTNPTLMTSILNGLKVKFRRVFFCPGNPDDKVPRWPHFGLVRIQWGGPWCKPGVPMPARYRQTHWIGMCLVGGIGVFDVNAMNSGGWVGFNDWQNSLVPWIIKECVPRADGTWWPTHCLELNP